ncbi:MAG: hypothetical protein J6U26_00185, partial [Lachnospiraceae bacterium]|nr:hypothetical protein [Lachnospiraceae bacterium]
AGRPVPQSRGSFSPRRRPFITFPAALSPIKTTGPPVLGHGPGRFFEKSFLKNRRFPPENM